MWQLLIAAAVAGSTGFVAKHILSPGEPAPTPGDRSDVDRRTADPEDAFQTPQGNNEAPYYCEGRQDEIFRFSCSGSSGKPKKKENKKKPVRNSRKDAARVGKKECGAGFGEERRKVGRRRLHVCLKRRKTGRNGDVAPKCGSCLSKDESTFNWGLGLGIMYMMSAGKSEIHKLNTAMDETAKVVKELKSELYKRKLSQYVQGVETITFSGSSFKNSQRINRLLGNASDRKVSGLVVSDDGEYASSELTEEPLDIKMTELEAELEFELQKLPWSMGEASSSAELKVAEVGTDAFEDRLHGHANEAPVFGVSPHILKQKLSHLLIEQQENQIVELETELHSTQSKLSEKEAELQALKECVRRLSNFSLSAASDDEMDEREGQECSKWLGSDVVGSESSDSRRPVVGMKRPIDSESCGQ